MPTDSDVLVVGGGPTGLAAAIALRQLGRSVTVIDPGLDKGAGSKALTIHAGTLTVLEHLGCVEKILDEGLQMQGLRLRTRRSILLDQRLDRLPGKYPFAISLPQPRTEEVLRVRAVEAGVSFTIGMMKNLRQERTTVSIGLTDGTVRTACYVIGADGNRSATREALGIGFPDTGANRGDEKLIALADVALSGNEDLDHISAFAGPKGLLLIIPLPHGRARLAVSLAPDQKAETRGDFERLATQRGPRGMRIEDVSWISHFQFSHRLADAFRAGRVLLAGDAAHVHSPVGGQGMNLGIRDASYAAAAIDDAMASGDDSPLEAYATNRRDVAGGVIALTNSMSRTMFTPPPAQPIRNTILPLVARTPLATRRTLEISGLLDIGPTRRAHS